MKAWIQSELCIGCDLCALIAPEAFVLADDGLAYIRQADSYVAGSSEEPVQIESDKLDLVVEATEECPAECIFLAE